MSGQTFEPTTGHSWLNLADRLQLERDLTDLPALADQLDRHYHDLLARGDRNPDDPSIRYPIHTNVLDLADQRHKHEIDPDPAGLADLARRIGARRLGILPTLESWLRLYEADMLDTDVEHTDPVLDAHSTVTTAAGWLLTHLDWIADQPGAEQLVNEIHTITTDLDQLGISLSGPDHHATGTVRELADDLDIPMPTIKNWIRKGWLLPINDTRPRQYVRREVLALRTTHK
jgi:transposase-like protein